MNNNILLILSISLLAVSACDGCRRPPNASIDPASKIEHKVDKPVKKDQQATPGAQNGQNAGVKKISLSDEERNSVKYKFFDATEVANLNLAHGDVYVICKRAKLDDRHMLTTSDYIMEQKKNGHVGFFEGENLVVGQVLAWSFGDDVNANRAKSFQCTVIQKKD